MFQTSYTGLKPLQRNFTYVGGFCKFWYIPVENVAVFPRVSAADQRLVDEPALMNGAAWFGPIDVPLDKLGFEETFKTSKAGPYYETKVDGIHIGDSPQSRVNLENMVYHKYLVVGKVRAGGFYTLIGTIDSPCSFNPDYKSGSSAGDTAQTQFSFTNEHISKAYIMPKFTADKLAPDTVSNSGGGSTMVNPEIIQFQNQPVINIPWTPARQSKYGSFPIIEVWTREGNDPPVLNIGGEIQVDAPPPAFTEMNVMLGGSPSGFIVIK